MAKKGNKFVKKGGRGLAFGITGVVAVVLIILVAVIINKPGLKESSSPAQRAESVHKKLPERIETEPQPAPPAEKKREQKREYIEPEQRLPEGEGKLAIIIDDMGTSVAEYRRLSSMKTPITFAVIPGLPQDTQVAEAAHAEGHEVIIHMPMEPQGYPQRRLEKNGLLVSYSDLEIESRVAEYLRAVPHADGANNHMGSRFTEVREKMLPALRVLNGGGLFFVDSRTSPKSVGCSAARELGMRTAGRNVFLDNVQDVAAIRKQLNEAATLAKKKGRAIAIGHPHAATMQALALAIPGLKADGITFVYARDLVN